MMKLSVHYIMEKYARMYILIYDIPDKFLDVFIFYCKYRIS